MGASVSGPERKIALLGKTGDGKSSTGNTILRQQKFPVQSSPSSENDSSELKADGVVEQRKLTIVDTPGIFDTGCDEETQRSKILMSLIECSPGVDCFAIVLKVGRYTEQEMKTMDKIVEYCGEETFKHSVVLFTQGEQLEGQTIEEFVLLNPKLQELVNKCGGRCHVIDNKYWINRRWGYRSNRVQVRNMVKTIDEMVTENGQYSNELMLKVENDIQEEEGDSSLIPNLSKEEIRDRAKKKVLEKYLIRFAGVATGTLIGAFLGVGVAVAAVLAVLKAKEFIAAGGAVVKDIIGIASDIGAAVTGIAVGVTFGAAALEGAIGGGVTGYRAAGNADSVFDAIKKAAKHNYENAKEAVKKTEDCNSDVKKSINETQK